MSGCNWCGNTQNCRSVLGVFLCEVCRVWWMIFGTQRVSS